MTDIEQEEFIERRDRMIGSMGFQSQIMEQRIGILKSLSKKAAKAKSEKDLDSIENELRLYNL
jgi:hypothetical protein